MALGPAWTSPGLSRDVRRSGIGWVGLPWTLLALPGRFELISFSSFPRQTHLEAFYLSGQHVLRNTENILTCLELHWEHSNTPGKSSHWAHCSKQWQRWKNHDFSNLYKPPSIYLCPTQFQNKTELHRQHWVVIAAATAASCQPLEDLRVREGWCSVGEWTSRSFSSRRSLASANLQTVEVKQEMAWSAALSLKLQEKPSWRSPQGPVMLQNGRQANWEQMRPISIQCCYLSLESNTAAARFCHPGNAANVF